MNYSMTVFTQPTCGPCNDFKNYLEAKSIEFINKDVSNDLEARQDFLDNKFQYTPTSIIEINGEKHIVVGGNTPEIEKLLNI